MSPLPVSASQRKPLLRAAVHVGLGCTALIALTFHGIGVNARSRDIGNTDFRHFYEPALNLREGRDLYGSSEVQPAQGEVPTEVLSERGFIPNLNPPFQTLLFTPFARLDIEQAYITWVFLGLLGGCLAAILIPFGLGPLRDPVMTSLVSLNLFLYYYPTFKSLLMGQWALVPFFGMVVGWILWYRDRLGWAGAIFGALAAIKLFFGAFFLFFVARREWRAAAAFCGVWVGCVGISLVFAGFHSLTEYFSIFGEIQWYSSSWNASVMGFMTRVFGEPGNEPLVSAPRVASALAIILQLTGLWLLVSLARPGVSPSKEGSSGSLAFSGCVVLMLLISPLGWIYYFPFLLLPLMVLWEGAGRLKNGRTFRWLGVLAWLLSTVPRSQIFPTELNGDPWTILGWAGVYTYSLILFLVLIWLLRIRLPQNRAKQVVGARPSSLSSP